MQIYKELIQLNSKQQKQTNDKQKNKQADLKNGEMI